jgi:hypothetical protein
MKTSKVSLNVSKATAQEVAVKAAMIVSKMSGNALFPTPAPALTNITNTVTLLNAKLAEQSNAQQTWQQRTQEVQNLRQDLIALLTTESAYVQALSGGDEAKILSAGFSVRKSPSIVGLLPAPKKVLAEAGGNDGEIIGTWERVEGSTGYIVELSNDISSPDNWAYQATVTKAKCKISGLETGTRIWIRVAPFNGAGQGDYSDPATKTVP